jgi:uncharacterized protein
MLKKVSDFALRAYGKMVLDHPLIMIIGLMCLIAVMGYNAKNFRIDASAETLLLESDPDLRYSREVVDRYGVDDFLLIAYTPGDGDLFSDQTLQTIARLRDELGKVPRVTSVITLLDVPLFQSPPLSYAEVAEQIRTLESEGTDRALAATEFRESPFYRDLLVSADGQTTALIVNLEFDAAYAALLSERTRYMDQRSTAAGLSDAEATAYRIVEQDFVRQAARVSAAQKETIATVRAIMDDYRPHAELFLGGVSMIQNDMIAFIQNDLKLFGLGVFALLVIVLGLIFRRLLWIVLPMLCCLIAVVAMMGLLGLFGWEVTVISSNFISLQLIMTLAIAIHLIVRYREYHRIDPQMDQRTLIHETVRAKFVPCLFATLTTIAGFSSLVLSDIKPVINFGWMMSAGLVVSLGLTFILFPATVMLMHKTRLSPAKETPVLPLTATLARFTQGHGTLILVATAILSVMAIVGVSRLRVENSFIDYFKGSTEIHQGMRLIDQKLGGTTPLDVIVRFDDIDLRQFAQMDDEDEDDLLNPWATEAIDYDRFWFFDDRLRTIEAVHDYLEGLRETGKVLSLGTLLKIGRVLNNDMPLESIEMAVLYTRLPEEYRDLILSPYLSIEHNEARFSVRIIDSLEGLQRDALLARMKHDLVNELNLPADRVRLAGMMVLYNNMLQSLFASQIKTMGVVALALLVMFIMLFRSLKLALIALFPNLFSAAFVLGVIGWLNIPLDMMTITIAAISVGIAVDNTIHYIHRFREEIPKDSNYYRTLHRCHGSIGYAMYYTSITIIIGFSILALSNFWPTIYFGLFTGLAMLIALIASLTLLPQLIVVFKPFGPEHRKGH